MPDSFGAEPHSHKSSCKAAFCPWKSLEKLQESSRHHRRARAEERRQHSGLGPSLISWLRGNSSSCAGAQPHTPGEKLFLQFFWEEHLYSRGLADVLGEKGRAVPQPLTPSLTPHLQSLYPELRRVHPDAGNSFLSRNWVGEGRFAAIPWDSAGLVTLPARPRSRRVPVPDPVPAVLCQGTAACARDG